MILSFGAPVSSSSLLGRECLEVFVFDIVLNE
jgi:hypothetical protein